MATTGTSRDTLTADDIDRERPDSTDSDHVREQPDSVVDDSSEAAPDATKKGVGRRRRRLVRAVAALVAAGVGAGIGWQQYALGEQRTLQARRQEFVAAAEQQALNLTTIRWDQADADVKRIIDGSTGAFRDDFSSRSASFADVVKQAKSTSEGTINAAGLESLDGNTAKVLIGAGITTRTVAEPNPTPKAWRMRITVEESGGKKLTSNVELVP
ncbi:hypothetical protein ACIBG0_33610 [Nocardia sp. NPDC050630]|uniref:hypothetical protein n=1 Tax=Nocardia sp. NPDC050630 TaxID=3364321 RepID=UPI0037B31005